VTIGTSGSGATITLTGGNFTAVGSSAGGPTTEDGQGVYGVYAGTGTTRRAGGYFYGSNGVTANFASVAEHLTNSKITGVGVVAEIIPTPNHGRIRLTAPESPEYWYTDYGTVQLVNGTAHVDLDPILADIIVVDAQHALKVFPQANIVNCNGLAVINKTATGFDLVEINNGTSSGEVDYQIVAKPKTNFGEGRFAYMPGPFKYEDDPAQAKAQNVPDWNNIYRWPADWDVYGYNPEERTAVGDVIIGGPNTGKIKLGDGKVAAGMPANNVDSKLAH